MIRPVVLALFFLFFILRIQSETEFNWFPQNRGYYISGCVDEKIRVNKTHTSLRPWNQGDALVVEKVYKDDEGLLDPS